VKKHIIIANFSKDSLALIQWAIDNNIENLYVLSVDTSWQSSSWNKHLNNVKEWLSNKKLKHHHIKAENTFSELVNARKSFPSQKFNWCSNFLKGITLLKQIDEIDENGEAIILLPHRKSMTKLGALLKEHSPDSERYDYRDVWRPILNMQENNLQKVLNKINLEIPQGRSLECMPCIHMVKSDFEHITQDDKNRTQKLEQEISNTMFNFEFDKIEKSKLKNNNYYDEFTKACSWDYACGL